ncbi:FMRFamide-like neuropeptide 5 family protein [Ostertagia ostertagi]
MPIGRVGWGSHGLRGAERHGGADDEVTTAPPIVIAPFEMSPRYTYAVVFIASLLVLQYVAAQSDDMYELQRVARAPKFIRFGRGGGAKFIRFGRGGTNTWVSRWFSCLANHYSVPEKLAI